MMKGNKGRRSWLLRAFTVAALMSVPSLSEASGEGASIAVVASISAGVPIEIFGTIGAVKAGIAASRGYRASIGWLIAGYLGAAANLGGAAALFADSHEVGAVFLAWGIADLALSLWSSTKPAQVSTELGSSRTGVTFAPLLGRGSRGGLQAGMLLSVPME